MDKRMFTYGLVPSADLIKLQGEANDEAERQYQRASVSSLTYDGAFRDAHDALVGLAEDLTGTTERRSLKAMLYHEDRLRGLGILLIAVALVGFFVDYVMAEYTNMGGGLMQLVAYGAQDIYLTGNPQITFFKVVYRRHTNYSQESIEQTFNGTPGFNKKVSCTISRNGDLITDVFLEIKLKKSAGAVKTWWPAEALVKEVELEIGGQRIDKHNSTWLRIYDELFRKDDDQSAYRRMVDFTAEEQAATGAIEKRFYVPLVFFFNRNPGLAIPLIALQYHEVKLNFTFEDTTVMGDAGIDTTSTPDIKLFVDYIYLDTDERRRFAQVSHEYLITQVQHTGDETALLQSANQNLRLNLNHPCKYLTWVFANPTKHGHFAGNAATRDTYSEYLAPLKKAKLQLNGHDRASERTGSYFNYTQPWQTMRARPRAGVYLYSFSLKPDEHQPSGSCNMSRIDNATLVLQYKSGTASNVSTTSSLITTSLNEDGWAGDTTSLTALRLYAENYNVLRIMSGMGGLAYSN